MKTIKFCLVLFLFSCLVGCKQLDFDRSIASDRFSNTIAADNFNTDLAEVAPPKIVKELNSSLEAYFPQVKIIAPQAEQTFNRTDIEVRLKVEDLPIFKDNRLQLGNHLNLIIDNEPLQPIYDPEQPILIKELTPGTHTIRVFAVRPWEESYKNEEAYDIVTFNVLTETNDNRPEPDLPLLTYNSPTGTYGAEPLLLDFYLTNAPLHAIAKNNSDLKDWRIQATVNGTSFILEDWQPIYLTGIKPGENWVQLELIDETGKIIENTFNNTVRVFAYNPQQNDALAKLFTDKVTLAQARALVKPQDVLSETIEPTTNINETTSQTDVDTVVEPETVLETTPIAVDEPTVSIASPDQSDRIAAQKLESSIIEPELGSSNVGELSSDVENTVIENNSVPTEPSVEDTETLVTSEGIDLDREQPVTTIDFTQLESVEKSPGEVATVIPETDSKPQANTSLWWKKILVGLRQKIEALAKTLPDEV